MSTDKLPLSQPLRAACDTLAVLAFITLGLSSHQQPLTGLLPTAAPFLLALLLGHLGIWFLASRRQLPLLLEGFMLWLVTLSCGLALRLSFGDTAATAFIIVSALTLLILLPGWRLIYWLIKRPRVSRA